MLAVKNLSFLREESFLFKDLDFRLNTGELLHLQGDNGVGKSTLLKLIAGLLPIEAGEVHWKEQPIAENWDSYCQQRFYIGHELALKENFSVIENLKYNFLMNKQLLEKSLSFFQDLGLLQHQYKKIYELSAGLKKKLSLCRLHFMSAKKLWILDEPFSCLDAKASNWLEEVLSAFIVSGGMVILTSHQPVRIFIDRQIRLDSHSP